MFEVETMAEIAESVSVIAQPIDQSTDGLTITQRET